MMKTHDDVIDKQVVVDALKSLADCHPAPDLDVLTDSVETSEATCPVCDGEVTRDEGRQFPVYVCRTHGEFLITD